MPLNPALRWQLIGPLLVVLGWDASDLICHWHTGRAMAQGLQLRDQWFLSAVLHNGARDLGWVALLALTVCIARPVGVLKPSAAGNGPGWWAASGCPSRPSA